MAYEANKPPAEPAGTNVSFQAAAHGVPTHLLLERDIKREQQPIFEISPGRVKTIEYEVQENGNEITREY